VKPGNIVGAIANEAGIESRFIGRIDIHDSFSLLDLPEGISDDLIDHLKSVWVAGQRLKIRRAREDEQENPDATPRRGKPAGKPGFKPGFKPAGKKPYAPKRPPRG
jgi:ATP-dependent RNA helicase DeaD